MSDDDVFTLIS